MNRAKRVEFLERDNALTPCMKFFLRVLLSTKQWCLLSSSFGLTLREHQEGSNKERPSQEFQHYAQVEPICENCEDYIVFGYGAKCGGLKGRKVYY